MIETIYIEEDVADTDRTRQIVERYPQARVIYCERYGEVFNRKQQNFRLQKLKPALILARKHQQFVLPTPEGYGIGSDNNYYFSHMLNCLYDCRYCFLQGMFRSAHYVLFVNYEEFIEDIHAVAASHDGEPVHFFSGYDCDSLALEPVSGFVDRFVPEFAKLPHALLELRTKSCQIRQLLDQQALPNVVVAYSLSPQNVIRALEHKTPSLEKRLEAIVRLQQHGWPVGLRFDPIIATAEFEHDYAAFFQQVFARVDASRLHSVTLGSFRLPPEFFKTMSSLYPEETLFNNDLQSDNDMISYRADLSEKMKGFCEQQLLQHIDAHAYFPMP